MIEVGIKDVKDARTVLEEMSFRWTTGPLRRAAMVTQDRAQSMYNATICHRSALPCFPYARRSGALAAVAGQTTTAAIKKDEAQERIEAPHSRAGRRLSRTGRVGHRGFHGAGERKRASLKLFCAATPILSRAVEVAVTDNDRSQSMKASFPRRESPSCSVELPKRRE